MAAVQRDVGAMLRCMQTMRRGEDNVEVALHKGEDEEEDEGPWGSAAIWAAPMQEVGLILQHYFSSPTYNVSLNVIGFAIMLQLD